MNQQRGPKFIDSLNKLIATALFIAISEQPPLGTRMIEREVNKLSGKLPSLHFDFRVSRRESKRAAGDIAWILIALIATHVLPQVWITERPTLEESAMQSYSAQSQALMQLIKPRAIRG
jgi:hypothetical protein